MTHDPKLYRECMAEIIGTLKKYDMAGAITIVDKQRSMFTYHFPTWSCLILGKDQLRFRSKREDYPSAEAQHKAAELSTHIVLQMRDIAAQTFDMMNRVEKTLSETLDIEHKPYQDFDPERDQ
jgi:hypothetical protein